MFNNITFRPYTTIMVGLRGKSTLADFVDKALLDYNFNRREKMANSLNYNKIDVPTRSEWVAMICVN